MFCSVKTEVREIMLARSSDALATSDQLGVVAPSCHSSASIIWLGTVSIQITRANTYAGEVTSNTSLVSAPGPSAIARRANRLLFAGPVSSVPGFRFSPLGTESGISSDDVGLYVGATLTVGCNTWSSRMTL